MKVLYLLDSLKRGGIEILALDVFRRSKESNLPAVFVATGGGELEDEFRTGDVKFIRLRRRLPIDLNVVSKLRRIINEQEITVIHTFQAVEGIHAFLAAKGTEAKVVLSHHGFVADKKNLYALRFLVSRVASNVFASRGLYDWYGKELKLTVPRTEIIYNGTDEKRLVWRGDTLKKELGLSRNAFLFGMIANFYRDPRKDQMTLCKSLPRIFGENPNAFCIFVGGVENGAESKFADCVDFCRANNLDNRVFFLGSRRDVAKILNSLDIFVLSSIHEGFGIVIAEAMLTGVPCIVSDIAPLREISGDARYAEIFPVRDAEVLSEKILTLLSDENRRRNLAARARAYARENYSIEAHIENLKRLYEKLN